ncbi:MAG: adenosylcobinamide-GDP ribazoletransferase [Candidatus Electrothrix sp. AR3]|nr:adenosylcobinamide-GDP ribazoletransferase [Candidatus Electrothrix sp. AR3]
MVLPPLPVAVLLVFLLLAFSGGLHLDGLADTADGFFSARSRTRMLEIMHDSTIGPMGVIALVLLLLLKVTCLSSLSSQLIPAILLMPIAGRTAILLLMALQPYARTEEGLGSIFAPYFNNFTARMTAFAGLIFFSGMAWGTVGARGALAVFTVILLTALFAALCSRKIGGITGDTLGAICELAEAMIALIFVIRIDGIV